MTACGALMQPGPLGGSAGEIHRHLVSSHCYGHRDGHRLLGLAVIVHVVHHPVDSVRYGLDGLPGHALGIIQHGRHVLLSIGQGISLDHLLQPPVPHTYGGNLGGQVALAFFGRPGIAADELDYLLIEPSHFGQLDGRDYGALLVKLGGQGERARSHAAHVGVMAPIGHETSQLPGGLIGSPPVSPIIRR